MPRSTLLPLAVLLAVLTTLFTMSSCRKVYDYVREHPDAHDTLCRISTLNFGGLLMGVAYNAKGNPLSLTELNPGKPTPIEELYFRYDRFDRLTDFMYTYAGGPGWDSTHPGDPLLWHKYAYPHPGIISDTLIEYLTGPLNGPSPIAPSGAGISLYKFDAAGKMIATAGTSNLPGQPAPVFAPIAYDARGNRDLSIYTNIVYDNAVNIYRTNKVWQLVFGDYSGNNPILTSSPPTPVNTFGLPTTLPYILSTAPIPQFDIYFPYVSSYNITYACSAPKGPIDY
jgi:hypothetical protein